MSERERKIASLLNSFSVHGDDVSDQMRSVIVDYFCEDNADQLDTSDESSEDSDVEAVDVETERMERQFTDSSAEAVISEAHSPETERHSSSLIAEVVPANNTINDFTTRRDEITKERKLVEDFLSAGCGCSAQCHTKFTSDVFHSSRLDCLELNSYEELHTNPLHTVLMGSFNALLCDSEKTVGIGARHEKRERSRFVPYFRGLRVCRRTFLFAHAIGEKVFKNMKKHFSKYGLEQRIHGNVHGNIVQHASLESVCRVKLYIQNYCEEVALVLPGRVSTFSNPDLLLLPSGESKQGIYRKYCESCMTDKVRPMSFQTHLVSILSKRGNSETQD